MARAHVGCRCVDAAAFRSRFPVLERVAYLNAGSCGPLPAESVIAARSALAAALHAGRAREHFESRLAGAEKLRESYARLLGCAPEELALTSSTSEGLAKVLAGFGLRPGDEVLTSDEEHPGLLGPLIAARATGVRVREAPFAELASAVGPDTALIACSHVSWITGAEAPVADLVATGIPVVLDGAQGAGAIAVSVHDLGVAAYAAAGQKWLCGADGTGMLYVSPSLLGRLQAIAPAYTALADPAAGLSSPLHPDARRHDLPVLSREAVALSLSSARLIEAFGPAALQEHAVALADRLDTALRERGRSVAARGRTTLVSWEEPDAEATARRAAEAGVVIRNLPGTPYARASVGAWNDDDDLERLLAVI
jgi:selenocysteine lyase/cysteine desulfurase